jgi:hypothetical protein
LQPFISLNIAVSGPLFYPRFITRIFKSAQNKPPDAAMPPLHLKPINAIVLSPILPTTTPSGSIVYISKQQTAISTTASAQFSDDFIDMIPPGEFETTIDCKQQAFT